MDPKVQPMVKSAVQQIHQTAEAGPFQPEWESLRSFSTPQWYHDGKFGIFIHWGLYCVPAFGNEWYPRNMYLPTEMAYAYHRAVYGPQDQFGYKDLSLTLKRNTSMLRPGPTCSSALERVLSFRSPNIMTASPCTTVLIRVGMRLKWAQSGISSASWQMPFATWA